MLRRLLLLVLFACGGSSGAKDAAPKDAAPDAPPDALPARCTPAPGTNVTMKRVTVVEQPATLVTSPPYDPRLFVVGQYGTIWIVEDDQLRTTPFLQITRATTNLDSGGEQGLLGLAFHPKYAQNGTFFIWYTITVAEELAHYVVLAKYKVSADPYVADAASAEILIRQRGDGRNHNGGMLEFGPDGYLYISTGDSSGPEGFLHAQDRASLLGKVLRIDVDKPANGKPYGIPPDNPYGDEIYMVGLRNPWRWSFDRLNHDMYIADVGRDGFEEITIVPRARAAGANLGWYPYEATKCLVEPCDPTGKTFPQVQKDHDTDGWCAIIGGQVYRGPCMPDVQGTYFFSDYCAGGLWSLRASDGQITSAPAQVPGTFPANLSSIHADERGELYATTTNGEVFHLTLP